MTTMKTTRMAMKKTMKMRRKRDRLEINLRQQRCGLSLLQSTQNGNGP
jgi:hypothetical protein